MNPNYVPALAALAGSASGGLTSAASVWLSQERQDRAACLAQDMSRRQDLYRQFIDEALKLYANALVRDQAEISARVSVYALIGRMRAFGEHCGEDLSNAQSPGAVNLTKRAMI
jgi:hypothetical protein